MPTCTTLRGMNWVQTSRPTAKAIMQSTPENMDTSGRTAKPYRIDAADRIPVRAPVYTGEERRRGGVEGGRGGEAGRESVCERKREGKQAME